MRTVRLILLGVLLQTACIAEEPAMPNDAIPLWPGRPPHSSEADDFRPYLLPFLVESESPRGLVVVFPGGGYGGRAPHEADVIAERLNEDGLHAVVCHYRVAPHRHPAPLLDAARAVRIVRRRAETWNVSPDRVAALGFSAGGHLAASLGAHHQDADSGLTDAVAKQNPRPDALVLCYPVISTGVQRHPGSFQNLLGDDPSPEALEYMSLEKQVTPETPPAFLWHTSDDEVVAVDNSLLYAQALSDAKVPYELHVYPHGRHGLGLAGEDAHVATWTPLCVEWLKEQGW